MSIRIEHRVNPILMGLMAHEAGRMNETREANAITESLEAQQSQAAANAWGQVAGRVAGPLVAGAIASQAAVDWNPETTPWQGSSAQGWDTAAKMTAMQSVGVPGSSIMRYANSGRLDPRHGTPAFQDVADQYGGGGGSGGGGGEYNDEQFEQFGRLALADMGMDSTAIDTAARRSRMEPQEFRVRTGRQVVVRQREQAATQAKIAEQTAILTAKDTAEKTNALVDYSYTPQQKVAMAKLQSAAQGLHSNPAWSVNGQLTPDGQRALAQINQRIRAIQPVAQPKEEPPPTFQDAIDSGQVHLDDKRGILAIPKGDGGYSVTKFDRVESENSPWPEQHGEGRTWMDPSTGALMTRSEGIPKVLVQPMSSREIGAVYDRIHNAEMMNKPDGDTSPVDAAVVLRKTIEAVRAIAAVQRELATVGAQGPGGGEDLRANAATALSEIRERFGEPPYSNPEIQAMYERAKEQGGGQASPLSMGPEPAMLPSLAEVNRELAKIVTRRQLGDAERYTELSALKEQLEHGNAGDN